VGGYWEDFASAVSRWSKKEIILSYKVRLNSLQERKRKDEVKRTVVQENIQYSKFLLVTFSKKNLLV